MALLQSELVSAPFSLSQLSSTSSTGRSASSQFFLHLSSFKRQLAERHPNTGEKRRLTEKKRASICRSQQGWFDFSTTSGGRKADKVSLSDFTILSHLQTLGCGDLKRKPREVHFNGCINESYAFQCTGGDFFVKINRQFDAASMFQGEAKALDAMLATEALKVPKPLGVGDLPDRRGSYIILEHLPFQPFGMMQPSSQAELGRALALMHLAEPSFEGFGFSSTTRLGVLSLDNTQCPSWSTFFVQQRLKDRLERAIQKLGSDGQELATCQDALLSRATSLLDATEVRPSVLHGDLWVGNSGLVRGGTVAVFDPAGFIGHSEFDLAFRGWQPMTDFPGFSTDFYESYHSVLPPAPGFEERHRLYQLFHLLNHLLIYGIEYYPFVMAHVGQLVPSDLGTTDRVEQHQSKE